MEKKQKSILIIILVIAAAIPSIYFGINAFIADTIEDSELNVLNIDILEMSDSQMNMGIQFSLDIETDIEAEFKLKETSIIFEDYVLGTCSFSIDEFSTGLTAYNTVISVSITNSSNYKTLIENFVNEDSLNITLEGKISFLGALSSLDDQSITKNIEVNGMGGLEYTLSDFTLVDMKSNEIKVAINATFDNPSSISAQLPGIIVEILYDSEKVGAAIESDVVIVSGSNEITLIATLDGEGNSLVDDFVQNSDINFELDGKIYLGAGETENLPQVFEDSVLITGMSGLPVRVKSIELLNSTSDSIDLEINVEFNNTANLYARFSAIFVDIIYDGQKVGRLIQNQVDLHLGLNDLTFRSELTLPDGSSLIDDFLTNDEIEFILNGKVKIEQSGSEDDLIQIFVRNQTIKGLGGINYVIESLKIIDFSDEGIDVEIITTLINPSSIETTLDNVSVDVFFYPEGSTTPEFISNTYQENVVLQNAVNTYTFTLKLSSETFDLIDIFLFNETLKLFVNLTVDTGSEEISIGLNHTINCFNGINYELSFKELKDYTADDTLIVSFEVQFFNPSDIEGNFKELVIDILYDDILVGSGTIENFVLNRGWNDFTEFDVEIDALGSNFIEDFITLQLLELNITCKVNISESGEYFQLFDTIVEISGMNDPTPSITTMDLVDSDQSQLLFSIGFDIENPSILEATFAEIWVDIIYNHTVVGNASAENLVFEKGINSKYLNAVLGGNNSAMEDILSRYITGIDSTFTLNISLNVSFASGGEKFEYSFEMDYVFIASIIELIEVDDIDISVTLTMNWSGNSATLIVYVDVTINNPVDFEIQINNFWGNIYFDDLDGYSFTYIISYNGDPASNIYIDNIDLDSDSSLTYPQTIVGAGSFTDYDITLNPSISFETGCRLYDERPTTEMYILNGVLDINIGDFNIVLSDLEFHGIEVDISL